MKNLLKTLSVIGLSLTLSLNAQISSNAAKSKEALQSSSSDNEFKSAYLANQDYLSSNSMSVYKNTYGDSLAGFNGDKIKTTLLSQGVSGLEIQGHMHHLKRQFINKKYGIGPKVYYMPELGSAPNTGSSNSKTIGNGNNYVNVAPCVNEGFESSMPGVYTTSTGVAGWTVSSRNQDGSCSPSGWTPGSTVFSLVATPILNWGLAGGSIGVIPNSPLGGTVVAQLNDHAAGDYDQTRLAQTFPVTSANTLFQFAYAGFWQDAGSSHPCCPTSAAQPGFSVKMYDCLGAPLSCSNLSLNPGAGCQSTGVTFSLNSQGVLWTNWQVKYIDLTPYIGTCVTIEFIQSDCSYGGHWGSCLIDAQCGGQLIGGGLGGPGGNIGGPVSFCAGSNQAQITAPVGYQTYQWFAPGTGSVPASQGGTLSTLVVNAPVAGSVYTVQLTAASGCIFTSTNAIAFSTVAIVGIGSTSTCPGGASGSGTVVGNGSGTGYNYTWINALSSATVGTTSIVNNLAPGTYSVIISAYGAAGCGSDVSTITIGTAPAGIIQNLKPFCGSEAYLSTTGGSNFQWYNGTTPIPAPAGTNPSYTVSPPINGSVYWLSYLSSQGCQDSVKYTLVQSAPGLISIPPTKYICPGANNGTATINLSPAPGAPAGLNSYSVYALGNTPAYNASLFPTSSNVYTVGGLSAGTYSVNVFDGSCKYGSSFNILTLLSDFTLTPSSKTICPGESVAAAANFTFNPSLGQYTYSWSPSNNLFGATSQNAIISPTTSVGTTTTIVYSLKVTPTLVACPVTRTMSIKLVSPPVPTITAIPNLCNNSTPYTIITNPPGGTFSTGITGTNNPISSSGGVISPSLTSNGINTFTYTITDYTCTNSNSASYEVSKFWSAALSSTVPPLCVTNSPFNLMNIVQNTSNGGWKGISAPSSVAGNQFNPAVFNNISYPTTGSYLVTYTTNSTPNPTVCPDASTLNVIVTKTTTPVITQVSEFCTNKVAFNMTVSPTGGAWLPNPNGAVSNLGLVNPANVTVPGMVVTYTVSDGPCVNSNTVSLKASQHYPAALSGPANYLCYNSSPYDLMSIVQNTTGGLWRDTSFVTGNKFYPGSLPTGTYIATYNTISWPTAGLCNESKTVAVSVLNPPVPTITQVGPICNNATAMQLSVTPNTGHWTGSSYLSSNGILTPSLTSVGANAVQYVIGTNTCNVEQTKVINVEAFVPATIISNMPDLCNTTPIMNLSPFTVSGLGLWSGVGISGTSFDPAVAGSGNFILTYNTASSPSGLCPDQATVAVNVYSLAVPVLEQIKPVCNNSLPQQILVSPVGGLFGGPSIGAVNEAGLFNPASALIGNNVINYSITSGPCVAYAQTTIKVERFISADLAKHPGPFCKDAESVNLNSYVLNPGGKWNLKPGTQSNGLIGDYMFSPLQAEENNVLIYSTNSETGLCPDSKEVNIVVKEITPVVIFASSQGSCAPVEVNFHTPSANSGEFIWSFDDGSAPINGTSSESHIFSKPGTYKIQLNYTDEIGCRATPVDASVVYVYEVPKADFSFPDEIYINEPKIQLTNLSTTLSDNKYSWKVGGVASGAYTGVSPVITFPKIGKYQVTLLATTVHQCTNEITKTLEVKNIFNVFIPNSFSPNLDGLNDYFMPQFSPEGLDTKSFEMEIFDRWGHSLFHTKDANSKGWDGSVQNKGEALKEEVYVYRIKYKDMDGNAYNKMGHVSLVK